MDKYISVAIGGALGAVARYILGQIVSPRFAPPFPWATFIINISGSFMLGFFLAVINEKVDFNPNIKLAIAVGFVGAYTTFSTFEFELFKLIEGGAQFQAVVYAVASLLLGFVAVYFGVNLGRRF